MRYKFATLSGSQYVIDTDMMMWKRMNNELGHEEILGLDVNEGRLYDVPDLHVGLRGMIQFGQGQYDYIHTTQIQRIELLDG